MSAYIIVDIKIHNVLQYEEYKKLTPASLEPFSGAFIVRGGNTETLEGDWEPGRVVVLKFPDAAKARQWWSSTEYAPAKRIRHGAASTRMILVEGVNES